MKIKMRPIACLLVLAILFSSFCPGVFAEPVCCQDQKTLTDPSPTDAFIDALFYRPIGLALIPIGAALFIVTLPFSVTGGNVPSAFDNMVAAPAKFTFRRPLGDI